MQVAYIRSFFDNMVVPYKLEKEMDLQPGQWVIISTKFGEDIGLVKSNTTRWDQETVTKVVTRNETPGNADVDDVEIEDVIEDNHHQETVLVDFENNRVLRTARNDEIDQRVELAKESEKAYEKALQEIQELELDMKLINVHFLLHRKKVIFNFTADNRVDFRNLVKRLASLFKTRIEMRQIGVRDAAKILGGHGVCGEECCCNRSNCHMESVFLKMAKSQGFVVNASKLTGICGRLMCCLAYENDFYMEERKKYPEVGSLVDDGEKIYRIFSVNVIKNEICASDTYHHQKKFTFQDIRMKHKDDKGVVHYQLLAE